MGSFQYSTGHGLTGGGILAIVIVLYALLLQALIDHPGEGRLSARLMPPLSALGEVSYSLYLTHPILKTAIAGAGLVRGSGVTMTSLVPMTAVFAAAVLGSVLLAFMFHRWVELPSQRLGRYFAARRSGRE